MIKDTMLFFNHSLNIIGIKLLMFSVNISIFLPITA